jgi:ubiquinone/menaquinone biosynthesis C-methylase UbiE
VRAYYDARAPEYDDWYLGVGRFAGRDRPGWEDELAKLVAAVADLPPGRTLDVACGTGFLTRHLRGDVTALDQSPRMLAIARARMPSAALVRGDALELPFADGSFDRVLTAHFYGHLRDANRRLFVREARRVARELVVVDAALRDPGAAAEDQERILNDGSRWTVYKRFFDPDALASELGGGETLFAGRWFVMVRA